MDQDDSGIPGEEPQNFYIELACVSQFKQPVAERLGQRLAVILPVPKFCKTAEHHPEIVWITGLQLVQKLTHRALLQRLSR